MVTVAHDVDEVRAGAEEPRGAGGHFPPLQGGGGDGIRAVGLGTLQHRPEGTHSQQWLTPWDGFEWWESTGADDGIERRQ